MALCKRVAEQQTQSFSKTARVDDKSTAPSMSEAQKAAISGVLPAYRRIFERAYGGGSRTAGIKAFCLKCVGFQRADIRDCSAPRCPLWPYRPYQTDSEPDGEA